MNITTKVDPRVCCWNENRFVLKPNVFPRIDAYRRLLTARYRFLLVALFPFENPGYPSILSTRFVRVRGTEWHASRGITRVLFRSTRKFNTARCIPASVTLSSSWKEDIRDAPSAAFNRQWTRNTRPDAENRKDAKRRAVCVERRSVNDLSSERICKAFHLQPIQEYQFASRRLRERVYAYLIGIFLFSFLFLFQKNLLTHFYSKTINLLREAV